MNWKKFNNAYWFELVPVFLLALIGNFFDFIYLPQLIAAVLTTVMLDLAISYVKNRQSETGGILLSVASGGS